MSFSNVLPETNCNIPMPKIVSLKNQNCEHCNKKNVCKYKERMEEAIDYLNNLDHDNERFFDLPLVIDIKCKEFNISYTGVR